MKVKVSQLLPNPFRRIEQYPIDEKKVDSLVTSMKDTEFWGGLMARKSIEGDTYELPYGHHRWKALLKAGIKEIEITVLEISDEMMIKRMANENMAQWGTDPKVVLETIATAKEFLDSEIRKYQTLKEFQSRSGKFTRASLLAGNEPKFVQLREQGVGRRNIREFLGKIWDDNLVRLAMELIADSSGESPTVDPAAATQFQKPYEIKKFQEAVKKHEIPVEEQPKLAKKIIEAEVPAGEMADVIREHKESKTPVNEIMAERKGEKPKRTPKPKKDPMVKELETAVRETIDAMGAITRELNDIKELLPQIEMSRLTDTFYLQLISLKERVNELKKVMDTVVIPKRKGAKPVKGAITDGTVIDVTPLN